jgi:hypothetical protein
MKDCVIFSAWIPEKSIELGKYYLDTLEKYHSTSDIIIGNNKGCCVEWYQELDKRNICFTDYVGPDISSDVSGFMSALTVLQNKKEAYRNIWFSHSKGSSYQNFDSSQTYRKFLENNFWGRKDEIDSLFDDKTTGLVSNDYMSHDNKDIDKVLNSMYDFTVNNVNIFSLNTFFVTDYDSIMLFLNNSKNFFDMSIINDRHDKIYFFEAYFCVIPLKLGKRYIHLKGI